MDIEKEFRTVKELLFYNKGHRLVDDLILTIENHEVDFNSNGNSLTREHLIDTYSTRQAIQKDINKDNFVEGYDETLLNLKTFDIKEIYIVSFNSDSGSYTMFTDKKKEKLIGLLKSKRTLTEIRGKFKGHLGHETKYRASENLFIKGKIKKGQKF